MQVGMLTVPSSEMPLSSGTH